MLFQEVKKILSSHKKELILRGVKALSLFGSIARNEATSKSDVDILIDFDSKKGLFFFLNLKKYLEELLQCEVDLVTPRALHPALKDRILREAKRVF
jgi:predicted nucleotidyltransferase